MIVLFAMFLGLPIIEVVVWLTVFAANRVALKRAWPYVAFLAVACCLAVIAAVLYYMPHSLEAYEGDEADPRGINMLALGFNAVCVFGVTLTLWGISFAIPRPAEPVRNHDAIRHQ